MAGPGLPPVQWSEKARREQRDFRDLERREVFSDPAHRLLTRFSAVLDQPTFIYFIQETDVSGGWRPHGPVKIGSARDPFVRLRELQCGNPHPLYIEELILGTTKLERRLHRWFADDTRVRGEWFGRGFEDAIMAMAAETARQQLDALKNKFGIEYIRDEIPKAVLLRDHVERTQVG